MRTWAEELKAYTHDYVRRGGKQNRRKQVSLIVDFLEYTDAQERVTSLHRIGARHAINFWKSHRELSEKTAYDYWLGLCKLWEWTGKPGKPPKPHKRSELTEDPAATAVNQTIFPDIAQAIRAAREARELTIPQLANLSGCELIIIEAIEAGTYDGARVSDIQHLFQILTVELTIERSLF
jgi:hypothetical protein